MISSLEAKAWTSMTITPTRASSNCSWEQLGGRWCRHHSSWYMPTINHWNFEPYTPFLWASQKTCRAQVSLKFPSRIRLSFWIRMSNWLVISSLKPRWDEQEISFYNIPLKKFSSMYGEPDHLLSYIIIYHYEHYYRKNLWSKTLNKFCCLKR